MKEIITIAIMKEIITYTKNVCFPRIGVVKMLFECLKKPIVLLFINHLKPKMLY